MGGGGEGGRGGIDDPQDFQLATGLKVLIHGMPRPVSKERANFASCSFDNHGLLMRIFSNSVSTLSKMMCLFNFTCSFSFAYFICFYE